MWRAVLPVGFLIALFLASLVLMKTVSPASAFAISMIVLEMVGRLLLLAL